MRNNSKEFKIGTFAPNFTLESTEGATISLNDYKGKIIILYFYSKDNTSGCTKEAETFRDVHKELTDLNTVVLGISKDSIKTHQNFKSKYNLPFPLLSDSEREVAVLYDVLKEKTMYGKKVIGVERSTFIIDEEQKFRHIMRKVAVNGHAEKCLELIKDMSSKSTPHPVALLNGEYIDINDPIVPLEDRGHQFGDGVYELVRVYNYKPFALELHLERLERSLDELSIPKNYTMKEIGQFHHDIIQKSNISEGSIYTQITRGTAARDHHFPNEAEPNLTMVIKPLLKDNSNLRQNGVKAITAEDVRWLRCDIKSLNLLGNILAKQKAVDNDCFEAILHRNNIITEGSSTNLLLIKDGAIYTHPTSNLILKGITRTIVLNKVAPTLGIKVIEKEFDIDFLLTADEAFVTGTTTEVMPIIEVNGLKIGHGKVGPVTKSIQKSFAEFILKECPPK